MGRLDLLHRMQQVWWNSPPRLDRSTFTLTRVPCPGEACRVSGIHRIPDATTPCDGLATHDATPLVNTGKHQAVNTLRLSATCTKYR